MARSRRRRQDEHQTEQPLSLAQLAARAGVSEDFAAHIRGAFFRALSHNAGVRPADASPGATWEKLNVSVAQLCMVAQELERCLGIPLTGFALRDADSIKGALALVLHKWQLRFPRR